MLHSRSIKFLSNLLKIINKIIIYNIDNYVNFNIVDCFIISEIMKNIKISSI